MKRVSAVFTLETNFNSTQQATSIFAMRRATMVKKSQKTATVGIALSSLCLMLAGCGIGGGTATPIAPTGTPGVALQGRVFGGQQPLYGATINLYAAGTTGYGSPYPAAQTGGSVSLLGSHVVTTNAAGDFNITGDYTCPTGSYVYIEAVGGSPDGSLTDNNPNVIMLSALGLCSNLSSTTYITMNELTTVASVWALAPFMKSPTNIGTSATNSVGLTNAFASVNTLVNTANGVLNTTTLPAGATIPTAELNTLGNILAACVNVPKGASGAAGNACLLLASAATPAGGTTPTDTLTASMNIAQNPGQHVSALFTIAGKYAQFGPTVLTAAPTDWTVSIRYTGAGALAAATIPTGIAADQAGNIWVTNDATSTLVKLSPTGTLLSSYTDGGYSAIAIDQLGNAWASYQYLNKITPGGTVTTYSGGGAYAYGIDAIAVDASQNIWAASVKYNTRGTAITGSYLSEFSNSGTAISPTAGYTGGGLTGGSSIAITTH